MKRNRNRGTFISNPRKGTVKEPPGIAITGIELIYSSPP
jgi:hypothetical protein